MSYERMAHDVRLESGPGGDSAYLHIDGAIAAVPRDGPYFASRASDFRDLAQAGELRAGIIVQKPGFGWCLLDGAGAEFCVSWRVFRTREDAAKDAEKVLAILRECPPRGRI